MADTEAVVALVTAPQTMELATIHLVEPDVDSVVIRTSYTSVSAGTERMIWTGRLPVPGGSPFPYVPGYECVGEVVWAGAHVPQNLIGQSVFVGGSLGFRGVRSFAGAQSDTVITPYQRVVALGDLPPHAGLVIGLAATALHGLRQVGPLEGQRVLVIGQGMVGILAARQARLLGARWVGVSDKVPQRLSLVDANTEILVSDDPIDAGSAYRSAAPLGSVDVLIEASGVPISLIDALPLLRRNGAIVLLGTYGVLTLPYPPLFFVEPRITVSREWTADDLPLTRRLLSSDIGLIEQYLTHIVPMERIALAYELAMDDPTCVKIVIDWTPERFPVAD